MDGFSDSIFTEKPPGSSGPARLVGGGQILIGFGCRVLAFDPFPNETCRSHGVHYLELDELLARSDIVTLHCPLTPKNRHVIDRGRAPKNEDRSHVDQHQPGRLIDTVTVIEALKSGKVGYLGLDVYEEEEQIFFEDRSGLIISDDVFSRLLTFPNVLITGHQAFFTREALENIASTTVNNITAFEEGRRRETK